MRLRLARGDEAIGCETVTVKVQPVASSETVAARFRAQRERDTRPELAIRHILHRRGLRYRVHQRPVRDLRRTVDVVFPRERVAVDIRGCFWHSCPEHRSWPRANEEWWAAKLARNLERDTETERLLADSGWAVLVVWEHEDPEAAADRVAAEVATRRGLLPRRPRVHSEAD
jgi:DNA mismatch endonuclease (patch repair protein)